MDDFIESSVRGATGWSNFNQQTDLSIQKLREWQIAAQMANPNMNAEEVTSSIMSLQQKLAQISLGQGDIAPFAMLGISTFGKNAFEILDQVREKFKNVDLDSPRAVNILQRMGITPDMINVLRLTDSQFKSINASFSAYLINPTQLQKLVTLQTYIRDIAMKLDMLKDQIVAHLAPELEGFLKNVLRWLDENRAKIIQWADNFISSLNRITEKDWFKEIAKGVLDLIKNFADLYKILEKTGALKAGLEGFFSVLNGAITFLNGALELLDKNLDKIGAHKAFLELMKLVGAFAAGTIATRSPFGGMVAAGGMGAYDASQAWNIELPKYFESMNRQYPALQSLDRNVNNYITNTFHVTGNNPHEIARHVKDIQQDSYNHAMASINNGTK